MKSLIKSIKSIKLKQVLTVFLTSCLLIIGTACSQDNVAQAGGQEYTEASKAAISNDYDEYDAKQDFKGGMNGYNDDRRYDSETAAKAKTLVDTAKRRQKDSLGEYAEDVVDRAGDRIDKVTTEIPRQAESNRKKAANYIQDKSDKLTDNLSKVPGGAKEVVEEAGNTAQNAVEDAAEATSKTTKNIKNNFKDLD